MAITIETPLAPLQVSSPERTALETARRPKQDAAQVQHAHQQKKLSQEEVEQIVREVNDHLQAMHTELNFSVDKETEKVVLKIINSKTHEVIRQIPAEEALRIASRLSKLLGLLIDGNA
jgi:flagellar protein FlaG